MTSKNASLYDFLTFNPNNKERLCVRVCVPPYNSGTPRTISTKLSMRNGHSLGMSKTRKKKFRFREKKYFFEIFQNFRIFSYANKKMFLDYSISWIFRFFDFADFSNFRFFFFFFCVCVCLSVCLSPLLTPDPFDRF